VVLKTILKHNSYKGPVIILTVAFLISRFWLYFLDVQFYTTFIHRLWQAIDVHLLRIELLKSLYYSHAQPPGFNLFLGILVKLFPIKYPLVFHLLNLLQSFAASLLIFFSLVQLRISRRFATIVALLFLLSPSLLLYEKLFSYTILTIFMVTLLVFLLISFLKQKSLSLFIAFCSTVSLLVLTRSSFHLFWMIIILLLCIGQLPKEFPRITFLKVAIFAMLITSVWYFKNLYVFNTFSASSWMGMNMARLISPPTSLGQIGPFKPLEDYRNLYVQDPALSDAKVLDSERKSSGYINYYHQDYLEISHKFRQDVTAQIKANPAGYLKEISKAMFIYFAPATHAPFIDKNLERIQPYGSWYNLDFTGFQKYQIQHPEKDPVYSRARFLLANGFTATGALPAFAFYVLTFVAVAYGWQKCLFSVEDKVVIVVLIFMVTYGVLVGNLIEFGENNRFRFEMNTAMLVVASLSASRLYHFFKTLNSHSKN
jgi:hypothetical protein